MKKLTEKQKTVLSLIKNSIADNGMPPTRAEIAHELGFKSANASEEHLKALKKKNAIDIIPGVSRGIVVKDFSYEGDQGIPLLGQVAAGEPILAIENIESHYRIDRNIFKKEPSFLLRVKGMSMRDAGILDGDLVAVHRTTAIRNRQIVVARLDDVVTIKRYKQDGKKIFLIPENPNYKTTELDIRYDFITIEGVVVGVVRNSF
ncbi:MAG: transcriptional repressor LexA [Pseudomonadota bacterium]|nr:transcriptional repressor LexA [Pseudomonadota bacterium]|tara:strand:+ start:182 stop:793 length:612 start_codon:yes stop_codon:yes gene_type:complete